MVWLWLLFPFVVLLSAVALWRAIGRLRAEQLALELEVDALGPVGEAARSVQRDGEPGRAAGQEQVDR
jgi:membrane protein implicated in regulation of membrane protease activity